MKKRRTRGESNSGQRRMLETPWVRWASKAGAGEYQSVNTSLSKEREYSRKVSRTRISVSLSVSGVITQGGHTSVCSVKYSIDSLNPTFSSSSSSLSSRMACMLMMSAYSSCRGSTRIYSYSVSPLCGGAPRGPFFLKLPFRPPKLRCSKGSGRSFVENNGAMEGTEYSDPDGGAVEIVVDDAGL